MYNNRTRYFLKSVNLLTVCWLLLGLAQAQPSAPTPLLGAAWYPEQWPEERWDADLALMQAAGIRMVRIGEFAWSTMEPAEGKFELDWIERAIAKAAKRNIVTVLGTPTDTPPAWLTSKYPDTLRIDENGRPNQHGIRRQDPFRLVRQDLLLWRAKLTLRHGDTADCARRERYQPGYGLGGDQVRRLCRKYRQRCIQRRL